MLKAADVPAVRVVAPRGASTGISICSAVPPKALTTKDCLDPTVTVVALFPKFVPRTNAMPPGHREFEPDSFCTEVIVGCACKAAAQASNRLPNSIRFMALPPRCVGNQRIV